MSHAKDGNLMHPIRIALWIAWMAGFAQALEISGHVVAEEDGRPISGALVRLPVHGVSALTDSTGIFRLELENSALRPPGSFLAGALHARVRAGMLEYEAADPGEALIDLYGTDGKLLRSLCHRSLSAGMQRVGLSPVTDALHGLGWLRINGQGRSEWVRLLGLGDGKEPFALARNGAGPRPSLAKAPASADPVPGFIDSLLVEKPGFYTDVEWVTDSKDAAGPYEIVLWKNSIYGMDAAEVNAWKDFLRKPAVTLYVGTDRVAFPDGLTEAKVELADGSEAAAWTASGCEPVGRPKSLRIAYAREGREYRDTVRLEALWKMVDSYRVAGKDSLYPGFPRFHLAWDWPAGFSAAPERDWIRLGLVSGFAEYSSASRPDVFQVGPQRGIEGGDSRYEPFDPARGEWTLKASSRAVPRFSAYFTVARRGDHDLRVRLDDVRYQNLRILYAFLNPWPDSGLIRAGQALRVQAGMEPGSPPPSLELIPDGAEEGPFLKMSWDGSVLDLPFLVRDTLTFRLKAWATDQLRITQYCQTPALSPLLRAIPSPTDTTAEAFEPNDSSLDAAPIATGQWIEAAWDYRMKGDPDADYYRFQAPAGARVRFTLRNPNTGRIALWPSFSDDLHGLDPRGGTEGSQEFSVRASGDQRFQIAPVDFQQGHYAFRIDLLP